MSQGSDSPLAPIQYEDDHFQQDPNLEPIAELSEQYSKGLVSPNPNSYSRRPSRVGISVLEHVVTRSPVIITPQQSKIMSPPKSLSSISAIAQSPNETVQPLVVQIPEQPSPSKPFPKLVMPIVSEQVTTSGEDDQTASVDPNRTKRRTDNLSHINSQIHSKIKATNFNATTISSKLGSGLEFDGQATKETHNYMRLVDEQNKFANVKGPRYLMKRQESQLRRNEKVNADLEALDDDNTPSPKAKMKMTSGTMYKNMTFHSSVSKQSGTYSPRHARIQLQPIVDRPETKQSDPQIEENTIDRQASAPHESQLDMIQGEIINDYLIEQSPLPYIGQTQSLYKNQLTDFEQFQYYQIQQQAQEQYTMYNQNKQKHKNQNSSQKRAELSPRQLSSGLSKVQIVAQKVNVQPKITTKELTSQLAGIVSNLSPMKTQLSRNYSVGQALQLEGSAELIRSRVSKEHSPTDSNELENSKESQRLRKAIPVNQRKAQQFQRIQQNQIASNYILNAQQEAILNQRQFMGSALKQSDQSYGNLKSLHSSRSSFQQLQQMSNMVPIQAPFKKGILLQQDKDIKTTRQMIELEGPSRMQVIAEATTPFTGGTMSPDTKARVEKDKSELRIRKPTKEVTPNTNLQSSNKNISVLKDPREKQDIDQSSVKDTIAGSIALIGKDRRADPANMTYGNFKMGGGSVEDRGVSPKGSIERETSNKSKLSNQTTSVRNLPNERDHQSRGQSRLLPSNTLIQDSKNVAVDSKTQSGFFEPIGKGILANTDVAIFVQKKSLSPRVSQKKHESSMPSSRQPSAQKIAKTKSKIDNRRSSPKKDMSKKQKMEDSMYSQVPIQITIEKKSSVEVKDSPTKMIDRASASRIGESPLGSRNVVVQGTQPVFSNVAEVSPYPNQTITSGIARDSTFKVKNTKDVGMQRTNMTINPKLTRYSQIYSKKSRQDNIDENQLAIRGSRKEINEDLQESQRTSYIQLSSRENSEQSMKAIGEVQRKKKNSNLRAVYQTVRGKPQMLQPAKPSPPPAMPSFIPQKSNQMSSQRIFGRISPSSTTKALHLTRQNSSLQSKGSSEDGSPKNKVALKLPELQELTREDDMSLSQYHSKRKKQEVEKQYRAAFIDTLSGGTGTQQFGASIMDKRDVSIGAPPFMTVKSSLFSISQNMDKIFEPKTLSDAQKQKSVTKMLHFLKKAEFLENTYDVLRELGNMRHDRVTTDSSPNGHLKPGDYDQLMKILEQDPDLIAQGLEKQKLEELMKAVIELRAQAIKKKVFDPQKFLNVETFEAKRNYEELYYQQRRASKAQQYFSILEHRMKRGDPNSMKEDQGTIERNLKPTHMMTTAEKVALKGRQDISDLEYIRGKLFSETNKNIDIEAKLSRLEEVLEKQLILLQSEGQQSVIMESALEEDTIGKIDDDKQIQQRLGDLMKKALHFTSSIKKKVTKKANRTDVKFKVTDTLYTQGWEAWDTESHSLLDIKNRSMRPSPKNRRTQDRWQSTGPIRSTQANFDPKISKKAIDPQQDELLQILKERYLGLDNEFTRKWKEKYANNQELANLHQIYQQQFAEPTDEAAQSLQQMSRVPSGLLELMSSKPMSPSNDGYDLPTSKLLSKNLSKKSLAPSIMPGGAITLDPPSRGEISHGLMSPVLNRNVSSKSIATMMTVAETEANRRKKNHHAKVRSELKDKKNSAMDGMEMKHIVESEATYERVLEEPNCLLPSLNDRSVIDLVQSPLQEVVGRQSPRMLKSPPMKTIGFSSMQSTSHGATGMPGMNLLNLSNLKKLDIQAMLKTNLIKKAQTTRKSRLLTNAFTSKRKSEIPKMDGEGERMMKEIEMSETKLGKFQEGITGLLVDDPTQALYYRRPLTYLANQPKLKVPQKHLPRYVSPVPQDDRLVDLGPMVDASFKKRNKLMNAIDPADALCIRQVSQEDLIRSQKRAVVHEKPQFDTTYRGMNIKEQNKKRQMTSEETGQKLREMFEDMDFD